MIQLDKFENILVKGILMTTMEKEIDIGNIGSLSQFSMYSFVKSKYFALVLPKSVYNHSKKRSL